MQTIGGDYDFGGPSGGANTLTYAKHMHQPARVITSSESGQVGKSKPLQLTQVLPNSFGQTSENQMNLVAANTIDFHHVGNPPQSNSRIYHIQQNSSNIPSTNKAQQMKNRKGINQSIDLKHNLVQ